MDCLIVDGYNVIHSWGDVFNLEKDSFEDCRVKLLDILSDYQGYKSCKIIVVFDAYLSASKQQREELYDNITVVYTKENETADNYIEKYVYNNSDKEVIRVVTSDYLQQKIVLSMGGVRMSPRELKKEVDNVKKQEKERLKLKPIQTNRLQDNLPPDILKKFERLRRQ